MSKASTAPLFPAFDSYVCAGESVSIEFDGFTITATVHDDEDAGAPWDNSCGHGEVSAWTSRDKAPGELVLASDRHNKRFYDFAGAVATARADEWGPVIPYRTAGIAAALAARADFDVLKAWCDDEWHYVGVALQVSRNGVDLTGEYGAALWGIECNYPGSDNSYLSTVANELLDEAISVAREAICAVNA